MPLLWQPLEVVVGTSACYCARECKIWYSDTETSCVTNSICCFRHCFLKYAGVQRIGLSKTAYIFRINEWNAIKTNFFKPFMLNILVHKHCHLQKMAEGAIINELHDDHDWLHLGDHTIQLDDIGVGKLPHDGGLYEEVITHLV